ncbi:MAG: hypothetical protein ACI9Y8_001725 [Candidatus Omnitrophota bacterium]|jgi:hypothetical protein
MNSTLFKYLPISLFLLINLFPAQALAEYDYELTPDQISQMSTEETQIHMDARIKAEEAQRQIDDAEFEAVEVQRLQELKERDPEAYAVYEERRQRQDAINLIITSHSERAINDEEARQHLAPLITDDIANEIIYYEEDITELAQLIIEKQNYIDNPQELLLKRVDQMLGLAQPE